jgi:catechol 2,3-dioxygenase-like lactoylglutathione lyase family enzyme
MTDEHRQPGVLGIHSLDHFRLSVPDLAQAQAFYERFGLSTRNAPNGFDLHTAPDSHRRGTFREGPRKQLDYLSFGAFADDLPQRNSGGREVVAQSQGDRQQRDGR